MNKTLADVLKDLKAEIDTCSKQIPNVSADDREQLLLKIGCIAAHADKLIYDLPVAQAQVAIKAQQEVDASVKHIEGHIRSANESGILGSATLVSNARRVLKNRL